MSAFLRLDAATAGSTPTRHVLDARLLGDPPCPVANVAVPRHLSVARHERRLGDWDPSLHAHRRLCAVSSVYVS